MVYSVFINLLGLKVWFLLEITERQLHENTDRKMTKTPRNMTKKGIFWQISVLLYY